MYFKLQSQKTHYGTALRMLQKVSQCSFCMSKKMNDRAVNGNGFCASESHISMYHYKSESQQVMYCTALQHLKYTYF